MEILDERILLVWLAATLAAASVFGIGVGVADSLLVGVGVWVGPAAFVVGTFLGSLYAAARYRTFRFECDRDAIYLERGVFTRVRTIVPVDHVRRVDIRRGLLDRFVGLERLVVYVDGPRAARVAIPGLSADRAATLQERLHERTVGRENEGQPASTALRP